MMSLCNIFNKLLFTFTFVFLIAVSMARAETDWVSTGPTGQIIDIISCNGTVYVLSNSGLYTSTDDHTWKKIRASASNESFGSVVVLHSGEMFLFSYSSFLESTDSGTTWKTVNQPGFSTRRCVSDNLDYMYSGQDDPIQRSTDKGVTWQASQTGTSGAFFDIAAFWVTPAGDIYAGNEGITGGLVYHSSSHGQTWSLVHSESASDVLAISTDSTAIWIAYSTKLISSYDHGQTWKTALSKPSPYVTAILFTGPGEGYAGFSSVGLFHTMDSADSWYNNVVGVAGNNVSQIFRSPRGNLLVGTDSGLFVQLPPNGVNEQRTGTAGLSLYPNPASNSVTVATGTAEANVSNMEVYDQLGRRLLNVDEKKDGATHSINTSSLEAGTYFVVAHAKSGLMTSKLVISR
jgi:photosystem II stability/assembly factor-like uncharacterized protein